MASMQPPMEAINIPKAGVLELMIATDKSQQQNRSRQDIQHTRCGIKLVWLVLQIVLVILSSTSVSGIPPSELRRLNYGVTFKPKAQLHLAVESWTHTFEITLPDHLNTTDLPACTKDAKTCSFVNKVLHEVNKAGHETEVVINHAIKSINELLPEKKLGVKSKAHHEALPISTDDLSRSIAGTDIVKDAEHLAHHIHALNKIRPNVAPTVEQHEEDLASYMKSPDDRINNIVQQLKTNGLAIENIQNQLYKSVDNLENALSTMIVLLAKHIEASRKVVYKFNEILKGVNRLVGGKVSAFLIQPETMSKAVSDIQKILRNKYPGFHLVYTDAGDIYRNVESLYAREGSKLYVAVKFPVTPFHKPLLLYDVLSFPVPVSDSTNHATQLLGLPEYFAITDNKQWYTTFAPEELVDCIISGTDKILCNINKVLTSMLTRTCVSSIFQNDKIMVKQDCDFRFLVDHVESNIFVLNDTSIIVYKTETLVFTCNSSKRYVTGCDFCMISVPCQCSISANNIYLPQRLLSCQENSIIKSHMVNLAVLQQFFNDTSLRSIESDSVFAKPLTITLPKFRLYNHSISQIIADDTKPHLSLQKMAKAAKNDAIAFRTLTEPLLEGHISIEDFRSSTNDILLYCSLTVTILCLCILLFVFLKLRQISTIIALLTSVQLKQESATTVSSSK